MASEASSHRYVRIWVILGIVAVLVILWFAGLLATVKPLGSVQSLEAVIEILPHAVDLLAGKTEHK